MTKHYLAELLGWHFFTFPFTPTFQESCQTLPRFCFPYDIQRWAETHLLQVTCHTSTQTKILFTRPLLTFINSERGMAWPCSTLLLSWLTWRDASALASVVSPKAHIHAFAYSGRCMRVWGTGFQNKLNQAFITVMTVILMDFNYSYLPWFEVFYKLLNNLADYLTKGQVRLCCLRVIVLFFLLVINPHSVTDIMPPCLLNRPMRWKHCWLRSTSSPYHWHLDLSLCRW